MTDISPDALHDEALARLRAGDAAAARDLLRRVLAVAPGRAESWANLGLALARTEDWPGAASAFLRVLDLAPAQAGPVVPWLNEAGSRLQAAQLLDAAEICFSRVIAALPGDPAGHANLGSVHQDRGELDQAVERFRAALALDPGRTPIWTNLAAAMNASPRHAPGEVLALLRRFDAEVAVPLRDPWPHANARDPDRRLRVGYLSADFRRHAAAQFMLPLIVGHRRERVEVTCYHDHAGSDDWTGPFRHAADRWVETAGLDDAALAERIRADGIDLLVDLGGLTGGRLGTFARRPAPVQVTWFGYVTSTGLSAMDWRLTDAIADPDGTEPHYAERLWRLPGAMWCFRPPAAVPPVTPLPAPRNGAVTFGAFQRFAKVTPEVLDAWARILAAVPDSRLLIHLPPGSVRERVAEAFRRRGVEPSRLKAFGRVGHERYWDLLGSVDIALDSFPFGGGTTTFEALWAGVPVVTCTGEGGGFAPRFSSRMGRSFLKAVGLDDLAAPDPDGYVSTAVALAGDVGRLAELRATLRGRMAASPLTDEKRFVAEVEEAYRGMWRLWCDGAPARP
ncbi:MAG TPA: tetratricopeptide repeat protein [Azospirillaceae bacterium]|nr:tetratricopeptide repeat protein [Azospirillaceae bacterium]